MKVRAAAVAVALGLAGFAAAARATTKPKAVAEISAGEGVLHEAFALSDDGGTLAYATTDSNGKTTLHVGPPGGKTTTTDITSFTRDPERILYVTGHWFVITNEGSRRAAVVGTKGQIDAQIGPFGDCFISNVRGRSFVTVTDRGQGAAGHVYAIAAYRPTGAPLGSKQVTIGADGTLAGGQGLTFAAFTGGYLQALVKKAGRYDAKADVRGGTELALLDVLSGKTAPLGKQTDIATFLRVADKRAENPGLEAFVRVAEDGTGLELIGPGERIRPLALPGRFSIYEGPSLQQKVSGGRLFFSLTLDPLNPDQVAAGKKGARALHVFEAGLATAKAVEIGGAHLEEHESYVWEAGGNRLAILERIQPTGRNPIVVLARTTDRP